MSKKKFKRKSRSFITDNRNAFDDLSSSLEASSTTGVNFRKIWISLIGKSSNLNNNNHINSNNENYLKPLLAFYQNHKHVDSDRLNGVHHNNRLAQKYPTKFSSYSSSSALSSEPVYGIDSIESTTSSYISFTNNLQPVSSLPTLHYNEYHNQHKSNEFYSIFVSVVTAAVFLFFIMWRWFKMNSEFRKALREQFEIQNNVRNNNGDNTNPNAASSTNVETRQQQICSTGSTRMALLPVNRWTYTNSFILPNTREELQATASNLIAQLSNGEYRSARQHQQMIDRARYCLQQLKLHAKLTQFQRQQQHQRRSNYSTFNSTNRSNLVSDYSTSSSISPLSLSEHSSNSSLCYQDILPPVPPVSITSLQTLTSFHTNESYNTIHNANATSSNNRARNSSVYNFNNLTTTNHQKLISNNEPPPDYESLMIKSCSLPSYSNLKNNNNTAKENEKGQEK